MQGELNQIARDVRYYWPSIDWDVHPTEAPWRNGSVESLVKKPSVFYSINPLKLSCFWGYKQQGKK